MKEVDARFRQVAVVRHVRHARLGMTPGSHGRVGRGEEDVGRRWGAHARVEGRGLSPPESARAQEAAPAVRQDGAGRSFPGRRQQRPQSRLLLRGPRRARHGHGGPALLGLLHWGLLHVRHTRESISAQTGILRRASLPQWCSKLDLSPQGSPYAGHPVREEVPLCCFSRVIFR